MSEGDMRRAAVDPLVMLATGMHGQPGVYALLLGSGVLAFAVLRRR